MERIITILLIAMVYKIVRGKAIHNAINLRLNPIFVKELPNPAQRTPTVGVFAKMSTEEISSTDYKQDLPKKYISKTSSHGIGCNNQVTTVLYPKKPFKGSNSGETDVKYLKIPIISQSFSDYKIIVATAPWKMRISGSEYKPAVIYLVFPDDNDESNSMNIPKIYFVKKGYEPKDISRKDGIEPLIIVDNNRTVTGLKSKAVSKYIKFKNKLNQ